MAELIAVLIALLALWLIGYATVRLVAPERSILGPDEIAGLAWFVGCGVCSFALFLFSAAGGTLSQGLVWMLSAVGAATAATARCRSGSNPAADSKAEHLRRSEWLVVALIALLFVCIVIPTVMTSVVSWDAMSQWALTAKIVYYGRTVWARYMVDPALGHSKAGYPMLLQLNQVWADLFIGRYDDRWVQMICPLYYGALLLVFNGACRRHVGRAKALVGTLVVATLYPLRMPGGGATEIMADVPLAGFCFAAAMLGLLSFEQRSLRLWALSAFLIACAAFTKREGAGHVLIYVLVFGLATIAMRRTTVPSALRRWLVAAVIILPLLVGWESYRRCVVPASEAAYYHTPTPAKVRSLLRERAWPVAKSFLFEMIVPPPRSDKSVLFWNGVWILLPLTTLAAWRETTRVPLLCIVLWLLAALGMYAVTYVMTASVTEIGGLIDVTLRRLLIHIVPLTAYVEVRQLGYIFRWKTGLAAADAANDRNRIARH